MMSKVIPIKKSRSAKSERVALISGHESFTPCSQDMTICGDCEGNRAKKKCPRLKEWLAKQES
jgi:hypothetical protein